MDNYDVMAEKILELVDYDIYKEDLESRNILDSIAEELRGEFK